jgi:S-formylglutathione hydrolase FrmB
MTTDITVLIPDYDPVRTRPRKFKTLYLLHGYAQDHFDWLRYTNIERYATEKNLAIVMPSAYNSIYTNMAHGMDYFAYFSEELPALLNGLFPLSAKPEDTYVAGLSMGGYGAIKWALSYPERFHAAASLSGALRVESRIKAGLGITGNQVLGVYGDPPTVRPEEQDLFVMLENLKKAGRKIPRLYICCGNTGDEGHYGPYLDFIEHAKKCNVELTAEEGTGGHDWIFWDSHIKKIIEWMLSF